MLTRVVPDSNVASRSPRRTVSSFDVADHTGQLAERTTGNDHLLPTDEHRRLGQVTYGEAVRVGGDHAQSVVLGGEQHAGQHGAGVVGRGGAHDLAECIGHRRWPAG